MKAHQYTNMYVHKGTEQIQIKIKTAIRVKDLGFIQIEAIFEATRFPIKRKIRINAPKIWQTR